jgi:hypothetical protein
MNADQVENLVARICDQQAEEADWIEFAALARTDAGLWRVLAETQRQQAALARALEHAAARAEAVDLPLEPAAFASPQPIMAGVVRVERGVVGRIRAWSGWGVAAAALLLLAGQLIFRSGDERTPALPPDGISTAALTGHDDAAVKMATMPLAIDDSARRLMESGRDGGLMLGEIPERVLIDARPAADGKGYELLYLRQFLEQTIVPDLYVPAGQDEQGKPTLVRFENGPGKSM